MELVTESTTENDDHQTSLMEEEKNNDIFPKQEYKVSEENSLKIQLSSIRQDMKDYCSEIDKFVEDNRITYKNGEVESFWGKENKSVKIKIEEINVENVEDKLFQTKEKGEQIFDESEIQRVEKVEIEICREVETINEETETLKEGKEIEENELIELEIEENLNESETDKKEFTIESLVKTMDALVIQKSDKFSKKQTKRSSEFENSEICRKRSFLTQEENFQTKALRKIRPDISRMKRVQNFVKSRKRFSKKDLILTNCRENEEKRWEADNFETKELNLEFHFSNNESGNDNFST